MGNDIKLPLSNRKGAFENRSASEAEKKNEIMYEIERISSRVTETNHQTNLIELNLKQINRNIQYYKDVIMEMSTTLHHIESEQTNANLSHQNYVERAKRYLESLAMIDQEPQPDNNLEEYSSADIASLENKVELLNNEVAANEEVITKGIQNLSLN